MQLQRDTQLQLLYKETDRRHQPWTRKRALSRWRPCCYLDFRLFSLQNCKQYVYVACKLLSMWHFVIAAWASLSQAYIFFKLEFSKSLLLWRHFRDGYMKDGFCSWLFLWKSEYICQNKSRSSGIFKWHVVQLLSHVQLFVTPWTAAHQASLSFTISHNLLIFLSIDSMMGSNHLILCDPFSPPALNLSQHQGLFQWVFRADFL